MWMLMDIAGAHGPEMKSRSWVHCRPRVHSAFLSEQEVKEDDSDDCWSLRPTLCQHPSQHSTCLMSFSLINR